MDEHCFTIIYRDHAHSVYNFIRWMTGNSPAADDILQNVFVKVWKSALAPSGDEEQRRWLYRIARNACLDHFRSVKRFTHLRQQYAQENGRTYSENDSAVSWTDIASLPETERSILYLHLKVGYTYKEIAEMIDISEGAVRVKVFRALQTLREKFSKKA